MGQERRQDTRYDVRVRVELFRNEKPVAELDTQNISISGLFLFHPKGTPVGDFLSLRLHLGEFGIVSTMGEVVHSIPEMGIGIRFFDMDRKAFLALESFLASKSA